MGGCSDVYFDCGKKKDQRETTPLAKKRDSVEELSTLPFGQRLSRCVVKPVKKLLQELDRATVWRRRWIDPDRVVDQYRRQFEQAVT